MKNTFEDLEIGDVIVYDCLLEGDYENRGTYISVVTEELIDVLVCTDLHVSSRSGEWLIQDETKIPFDSEADYIGYELSTFLKSSNYIENIHGDNYLTNENKEHLLNEIDYEFPEYFV